MRRTHSKDLKNEEFLPSSRFDPTPTTFRLLVGYLINAVPPFHQHFVEYYLFVPILPNILVMRSLIEASKS